MHIICGDQYASLSCLREELSSNRHNLSYGEMSLFYVLNH